MFVLACFSLIVMADRLIQRWAIETELRQRLVVESFELAEKIRYPGG